MFGNPGSLTMYSTAKRGGMADSKDTLAGPADYQVTNGSIRKRNEMVAPFDTTAKRSMYTTTFAPGPAAYSPDKPRRDCHGSPLMIPDHYPAGLRRGYRSEGPGPIYKIMDQFDKMALDVKTMSTKKPRVNFEKFVSNCCPTIYHPQDIRCFVEGIDGRMYPWKINRNTKTPGPKPLMIPDHYPAGLRRGYRSEGPGPIYKIMDQFDKMALDVKTMSTKKPRVNFEKFVSNCCPTIYHPQDIRCFVEGIDGRMYPWKINRNTKTPGPKYNTFGVETSRSKKVPKIDFSNGSKRPPLFKPEPGFGPADFMVSRSMNTKGGIMLSKTSDPRKSDLRYFDKMARKTLRDHVPHPFSYYITSSFDEFSSKAVSAPFKSKTKSSTVKTQEGPLPAAYFQREVQLESVSDPKIFGICTYPPDASIKSFNSTEPRFFTLDNNEQENRPDPGAYTLKGFADELLYKMHRHKPAFRNPKLGFLVSAQARPATVFKHLFGEPLVVSRSSPRRPWKNVRPRKGDTYPYHGPPFKHPDSPGPIYDINPGFFATKGRKSWNDPRRWLPNTAFLVSGCTRNIRLSNMDKDIPGPGKYYPKFPTTSGSKLSTSRTRVPRSESVGPGPSHKLHEKMDSSVWRASHLGTFNSKLKQIGVSHPSAGGFRAKVIDKAADKAWRIQREDDYAEILSNPNLSKCMTPILKVRKHEY